MYTTYVFPTCCLVAATKIGLWYSPVSLLKFQYVLRDLDPSVLASRTREASDLWLIRGTSVIMADQRCRREEFLTTCVCVRRGALHDTVQSTVLRTEIKYCTYDVQYWEGPVNDDDNTVWGKES